MEKDEESIIKRKLSHNFMNSKTTYKVLKRSGDKTQVLATLHTGKTHQLRLHFASMEHPIIGDELYGNKTNDNIFTSS
ncbi:MAG: pseudouridine synthase [Christensenellales bacterium]